jgi:hypothetical protein
LDGFSLDIVQERGLADGEVTDRTSGCTRGSTIGACWVEFSSNPSVCLSDSRHAEEFTPLGTIARPAIGPDRMDCVSSRDSKGEAFRSVPRIWHHGCHRHPA